ncbi:MAG TPA: glycoside hydrolase family 88 protein, partial [Sphaerochaeta sp.]|nr:glycoside hydrolase family 88 protein [Sphaerochaeta sp.]
DIQKQCWVSFGNDLDVLVDGKPVISTITLDSGLHSLVVYRKASSRCPLTIKNAKSGESIALTNPLSGFSSQYPWLLAGPFDGRPENFIVQYLKPFITSTGLDFWHLQGMDTYLRLYNDNPLFGHWNYPLGVTLYGLVEAQRMLKGLDDDLAQRISSYLVAHVQTSADTYSYAMWDKETLGGATAVHHLMTSLDSLDDCGSFGATLLEIGRDHQISNYQEVVEVVGNYISKSQPRLSDGTFFRTGLMHEFHENTLWVDDLYMSVPFLCRYSQFKGDSTYLDDAAKQFIGFSKYLYMKEEQLMSHVYDFDRNIATGIPWGRGNGWALFSLSELLLVLNAEHPRRSTLLSLFRRLSEGYLRLQEEDGMFHQVLNMDSSYRESSCTAMFACSFSRGVRMGWYENPTEYELGCKKACQALKEQAIDRDGHVWGVCRGSEFSCSPHYYADELLPRLDDTHGIGIILLALCERMKLG